MIGRNELVAVSVSKNTRRAYQSALSKFGTWLAGAPVTDGSRRLAELHEAGKSPQTCSQVVAAPGDWALALGP